MRNQHVPWVVLAAVGVAFLSQFTPVAAWARMPEVAVEPAAAEAADAKPSGEESRAANAQFLRLLRDEDEAPLALQAAVVRHVPRDGDKRSPVVDLVSAVHVAEGDYYKGLNRDFNDYDVVLYELVAPQGTRVPKGGGRSQSPVSALQRGIKTMLELEFQLEQVDYTAANMVHADMSPEQFAESMRRKGESMLSMFLRMMGHAMARQQAGGASDAQLLFALFDKNRALALKRVLAEQFQDMEGSLLAIEGKDGSTIISERNKVALEVLRKQIEAGHKKIAIFYGAGHMSDFQKRLADDFDLKPASTRWLDAWNLRSK
jgi:hypothetical protein